MNAQCEQKRAIKITFESFVYTKDASLCCRNQRPTIHLYHRCYRIDGTNDGGNDGGTNQNGTAMVSHCPPLPPLLPNQRHGRRCGRRCGRRWHQPERHRNGVTIDVDRFQMTLERSLRTWKQDGNRGVWLNVPSGDSALIPICVDMGFEFQYAKKGLLVLTKVITATVVISDAVFVVFFVDVFFLYRTRNHP